MERLGGSLSTLDAGGNTAVRQALADAAERLRAAEGQLAHAYSPLRYGLVTRTAIEGLHHIRSARTALGLDPGPELPAQGVGGQVTVGGQTYTASARHEHAVLPPGRGGRRPFRAGRLVPHALVEDRLCRGCRRSRGHGARGRAVRRVPPSRAARGLFLGGPGGPGGFGGFGGPGPL
ncbi:hypothetical protein N7U49_17950 [Streptomyces sp. AD2-2]|nr:hypothetical protein N7U49_17950 [Streptomyces sp. AD2-2]